MAIIPDFATINAKLSAEFAGVAVSTESSLTDDMSVSGKAGQGIVLHLYHAPNSICSQKVRTVLTTLDQSYVSHQVNIFEGENYSPHYVRLRAMGCRSAGYSLATVHTGSTSVNGTGCDACVVPTLVDEERGEVLVDSYRICLELDRRYSGTPSMLMPEAHRVDIEKELAIIDELPNYQLLAAMVAQKSKQGPRNSFSLRKVERCEELLLRFGDDALLSEAYQAKLSKEKAAADHLFDDRAMALATSTMSDAFSDLNDRLLAQTTDFLFSDQPTMADLFWGLELIRADDLGLSSFWRDGVLPRVSEYYERLCGLPAIRQAVIEWPGARLGSH